MQCTNPICLVDRDLIVPCGKCLACRIRRSSEWAVRLLLESDYYERCSFYTFTYNDEKLPIDGCVSKDELVRFMKRLRKEVSPRKIKYYACGEYGEKKGRPHYHAILLGVAIGEKDIIKSIWENGNVFAGTCTYQSARYVVDYVSKCIYHGKSKDGRSKPFVIMSKGLGKRYALEHKEELTESMSLKIMGDYVGIPRYILNAIDIKKEKLLKRTEDRFMEIAKYWTEKGVDIAEGVIEARKQTREMLKARQRLSIARRKSNDKAAG